MVGIRTLWSRVVDKMVARVKAEPWLLLITLGALLIRLPYWEVIPASFDEVNQTVYAFRIVQERSWPLVGNDAYAGPFYFYLLAALIRLGATNPLVGRLVVMTTGTLTVPMAYGWVCALRNNRVAGLIAATLVALNPDMILVNSHMGGSTFLLPFFTTGSLWGLTLAVRRGSLGWLVAGAIAAGLALQSNPVAGLVIVPGMLWSLWQTYRLQPRKKWLGWAICAGLLVLLVYSPVIIYNLTTGFRTVDVLQERSYLWQDNPTLETTVTNLQRFSLQTIRQVSGVVRGDERFSTLLGVPLLYIILMAVGLAYTSRYVSLLPLAIIIPFFVLFPIFSSHYGFVNVGRFTTLLIPVWASVIGCFLAAIIDKIRRASRPRDRVYTVAVSVLAVLLWAYPVASLFQYYQSVNEAHGSGRALLEISRYAVAHNQGEPIYISTIEELSFLRGIPYLPHATFLLGNVQHEFLSPQQMMGRLYENPGQAAFFLLSHRDADVVQGTAPLERVAIPANEEAGIHKYGLYRFEGDSLLPRPDFVLSETEVPEDISPTVTFGGGIQLLGCDVPSSAALGGNLTLHCYWKAVDSMPREEYVGFVHLIDLGTMMLLAQDDHLLGQESYPPAAWQRGEVVRESYTLAISGDQVPGVYHILLGIYTWPNQIRLNLPESADNVVALSPVDIR